MQWEYRDDDGDGDNGDDVDDYDGDDDDDDDDDSGREAVGVSHAAPPRFRPLDNGRMGGVHSTGCGGFIGFIIHKSM